MPADLTPQPHPTPQPETAVNHQPQAKQLVSPALRAAARALDADADIARLKATLGDLPRDGEGLPVHCFLTLRMGTELVKVGIGEKGLSPHSLATLLVRGVDGSGNTGGKSRFEVLVDEAYRALAAEVKALQQGQQAGPESKRPQRLLGQEAYHGRFMALFGKGLREVLDGVQAGRKLPHVPRGASAR